MLMYSFTETIYYTIKNGGLTQKVETFNFKIVLLSLFVYC